MAEALLYLGNNGPDDTFWRDGDPLNFRNDNQILCVNAEHICNYKKAPFNSDGLRDPGTLLEGFKKNTYKYKFERASSYETIRTTLLTGFQVVLNYIPKMIDGSKQAISINHYLSKGLRSPQHVIFGTTGNEFWYGGERTPKVQKIWDFIELNSPNLRVNNLVFPWGTDDYKVFLPIKVKDFTNADWRNYEASEVDKTDLKNPVTKKLRRFKITWQDLPGISGNVTQQNNILNFSKSVDIRKDNEFDLTTVLETKK